MNEKIFVLASQKKTTSHVMHLLLTIVTCGLWLLVWGVVSRSNTQHNKRLDKEMNHILRYKEQGLSDVDTYRQIKQDKANADVIQGRVIFVVLVVVFLYFYLR